MEMIDMIGHIPLFQGLPEKQLAELSHIIVDRKYKTEKLFSPRAMMQPVFLFYFPGA